MEEVNRLLDHYRLMCRARLFEERLDTLFTEGRLDGTTHLAAGQEATAVGACCALEERDYVVSNHRGHAHMIARGADPNRMMAELMGRETGYCGGRGGSQHMCAMDIGFLGTNGITGGGLPIATGAAFGIKYKGENRAVLCFFGDGASNQGTFHESLNMAAIWDLPVVFLCENNLYGMSTAIERVARVSDVADRASAYAIPGVVVDGMDVEAVYNAVLAAADLARDGGGPTLIEAKTYRYFGHSKSDRRIYRTRDEEADWHERDPIMSVRTRLAHAGISDRELAGIYDEERAAIDAAVAFAEESPFAPAESAAKGVLHDA